ncbi:MAG: copper homeostasis periplasmic binding protein CopC [Phenylobacterium sp.]|nr:copper homeostasis periplasmic binding protein CopC [Phenylobacterium sp.]
MKPSFLIPTFVAAAAAFALLSASAANAHTRLLKASPAVNAAVGAPKIIHLEFSERLEPMFSGLDLMKANGASVAVRSMAAGKVIDAAPKAALKPGSYMVMWHVVSADGHKMKGQYNFTVK